MTATVCGTCGAELTGRRGTRWVDADGLTVCSERLGDPHDPTPTLKRWLVVGTPRGGPSGSQQVVVTAATPEAAVERATRGYGWVDVVGRPAELTDPKEQP